MSFSPSFVVKMVSTQMLKGLDGILTKAEAHAEKTGVDEVVFLQWRAAPDMFPMVRQVQVATELPARGLARLAGVEVPSFPDTEDSLAALRERVAKSVAFVEALDDAALDADMDGEVTFPARGGEMTMTRGAYLTQFVLPNLYFHVTAAYTLLRGCGVEIGKADYLAMQ